MKLTGKLHESEIEELNKLLLDYYGRLADKPRFRIVWSDDQFETRLTHYTRDGLQLLTPVWVEAPKYRQYIHDRYILEELTPVPEDNRTLKLKLSYECKWVFQSNKGIALVPFWEPTRIIVESILGVKSGFTKYKDAEESEEVRQARIDKLMEELWGDESDIQDALRYKQGVVVPGSIN